MKKAKIKGDILHFEGGGISIEGAVKAAKKYAKEALPGGPYNAEEALSVILSLVEALQDQVHVAKAAKAVHAALQEDEGLLEAVDAAYRLGGAQAVRDLLLRGVAQGSS